jgi:HK97 gp10 family phage protein
MQIKTQIIGDKEVIARLKKASADVKNNLANAITKGAFEVERTAKQSMTGTGRPHIASRPGQPPAVDTGKLRASITTVPAKVEPTGISTSLVGVRGGSEPDKKNYGHYLEFGTSRIAKRPFLNPALDKQKSLIGKLIETAVRRITG